MVYVAVRFVCAFVGGVVTGLGGILPTLVVLAVVVFLIRAVWRILSAILFLSVLLLFIILFCVILWNEILIIKTTHYEQSTFIGSEQKL